MISMEANRDSRSASELVGLEVRESALAFGAAWAKQYFGARAENALIPGRFVREDAAGVMAAWDFPDEEGLSELAVPLDRARLLAELARVAFEAAREPRAQVGRPVARVFDFALESGNVYTGEVIEYLEEDEFWKIRHVDGDEEDLDRHELSFAYYKLEEHTAKGKAERARRRVLNREANAPSQAFSRRKRRVSTYAGDVGPRWDDASFDAVLQALSSVDFPVQASRTNVTRGTPPRGVVLGAVNIRGHGGMQPAQATRDMPNLAKLLARFFREACGDPDFRYTTIQINANYEAALHVDKFNLGPSYIVGVGDWGPPDVSHLDPSLAGQLWVHGRGPLDCRRTWQAFDGNSPHCTLPFSGTRFTLIYFTHCSQSMLRDEDRVFLTDLGFAMPQSEITKAPHMRTAEERLEAGRLALKLFLNNGQDEQADQSCALTDYFIDGTGGRPSSRVAELTSGGGVNGAAPQLKRHYGYALRQAAESAEAKRAADDDVQPVFRTGSHAGREASAADASLAMTSAQIATQALTDRPAFVPRFESWELAAASKKNDKEGARLLAKYAGLFFIDDDPYGLQTGVAVDGPRTSDAVLEAQLNKAREAKARGEPIIERRVIRGIEWCRFARHWTVVSQLAEDHDEDLEKYPIDKQLIKMILAASDWNSRFDFYDADACRAALLSPPKGRKRPRSDGENKNDALPTKAVNQMIADNIRILVRQDNPKRGASAIRYEKYKHATTAKEYLKKGGSKADLRFDFTRGWITLPDGKAWEDLPCVVQALKQQADADAALLAKKDDDDDDESGSHESLVETPMTPIDGLKPDCLEDGPLTASL